MDHNQNLISYGGGQDTSASQIGGLSWVFWEMARNLSEPTDRQKNGQGWSDEPMDPCVEGKIVFQASDRQMDGRTTQKHNTSGA